MTHADAPAAPQRRDTTPERVGAGWVGMMLLAQFGVFMAQITVMAFTLSVRLDQLAPGHEEYLGYLLGVGSLAAMVASPVVGTLSDRTRSRFGRRRPWILLPAALGLGALLLVALAPTVPVLGLGWIACHLTWGVAGAAIGNTLADTLPPRQRGKVAGLAGMVTMAAPITGILLAGALTHDTLLLLLVPGAIGLACVLPFVLFGGEPDSRHLPAGDRLTVSALLRTYTWDVRAYPAFSWNWLGRFVFTIGMSYATSFTAFFFAARLGVPVDQIGALVAMTGLAGGAASMLVGLGGGFLSDRVGSRKPFVVGGAVVFALGAVLLAFAHDIAGLTVGVLVMNGGLGAFMAVGGALVLDVLPERATQAGRFNAINGLANALPQALAPLTAPALLTIGAVGADKNYQLLYLVAAAIAAIGGLIIVRVRADADA